ncbi:hypothetical protein F4805DRAFT_451717 [Annulohypoxylon moriforme]|nr:hypothetical protein F4805DRAFT_451717 [Annulohypoxylon moriforme]
MTVDIEWIDLSKNGHGTDETRIKVRSHAMKATAAMRRRTGTWGDDGAYTDIGHTANTRLTSTMFPARLPAAKINPPMPLSGVELLAAEIGIHILDLSALTEIQCGWTACAILASQRDCVKGLVSFRPPSYLHCVASRYGSSAYLDEALRCVAIRAKRVLAPSYQSFDEIESRQYVTALRSLQKAVDDIEERIRPDVLCAVNLLSLFELLYFTRQGAWALHTAGAYRLIRVRGPESFVSDFDIRLLLSMATPITHECLRKNEPCCFEEDSWQNMLQLFVVATEPFSSRSQLAISLIRIMVRGPRLVRDVRVLIGRHDTEEQPGPEQLKKQLRDYRKELLQWRAEYDSAALMMPSRGEIPAPNEDIRSELLATCYGLFIICCRLMSAISTDLIEILEDEAVTHARRMIELENDISPVNRWASFYICQKLVVARATLATTDIWREVSRKADFTGIVEEDRFEAWWSVIVGLVPE